MDNPVLEPLARMLVDEAYGDNVVCFKCAEIYVHPVGISINAGGRCWRLTAEGMDEFTAEPVGRGVAFQIQWACEQGHLFAWSFKFAKGTTSFEVPEIVDLGEYFWPNVIWRD